MADDQEAEGDGNGHDNNEGRHHVIQLRLQGEMYIDGTASMGARLALTEAVMVNVSDTGRHGRQTVPASVGDAGGHGVPAQSLELAREERRPQAQPVPPVRPPGSVSSQVAGSGSASRGRKKCQIPRAV
jgi:hypothetical protein